jgi:hypothetical protein
MSANISKIRFLAQLALVIAAICCVATACKGNEDEFPDKPYIEFRSMTKSETGLDIVIYFEDGNGDINILELIPILFDSVREYAIFVDTLREENILANEDTTMFGCYRIEFIDNIKEIDPVSANGSMKGTITRNMDTNIVKQIISVFPEYKRYFRIILYDRAGNSDTTKTTEL